MTSWQAITSWHRRNLSVGSLLFFICLFIYVWLRIEPCLIYHAFGRYLNFPVFIMGWDFFTQHLGHPGGLVEYFSAFLSQYYYYSWVGALIIVAVAWQITRCTAALIKHAGGGASAIHTCLPAILLVIPYNRYDHPLEMVLALLTGLWFFLAYKRLPLRDAAGSGGLFTIMFALAYYLAAGGELLLALLALTDAILLRRRLILAGFCLVVAAGIPFLCYSYILDWEILPSYFHLSPYQLGHRTTVKSFVLYLYLYIWLVFLAVGLWQKLIKPKLSAHQEQSADNAKLSVSSARRVVRSNWAQTAFAWAVVFVIAAVALFVSFRADKKKINTITYFSDHKLWSKVLAQARDMPAGYNFIANHHINKALYYTGRLGDEMFCYPQSWQALVLFPSPQDAGKSFSANLGFYTQAVDVPLQLGDINFAQKNAYEALESIGPVPALLQQLALTNVIKGSTETARYFLNALSKNIIHRAEAKKALQQLKNDGQLAPDDWRRQIRSFMYTESRAESEINFLLELLNHNRHNRMAFEYLMAHYLLTKDMRGFVANLHRLDDFGSAEIPRHYEEAILLYQSSTGRRVRLHGRHISADAIASFERFTRFQRSLKNGQRVVRESMPSDLGQTYFFYYVFTPLEM